MTIGGKDLKVKKKVVSREELRMKEKEKVKQEQQGVEDSC